MKTARCNEQLKRIGKRKAPIIKMSLCVALSNVVCCIDLSGKK